MIFSPRPKDRATKGEPAANGGRFYYLYYSLISMRFIANLIEVFCWCWIFLCPTIILGFIGFVFCYNYSGNIGIISFIGLSVLGSVLGVYFAEKVRKSMGCTVFLTMYLRGQVQNKNENK